MLLLAAGWSFAEAILFFIVADVPISAIALRWGWRRGVLAAAVAALGAAAGGAVLYAWAAADPAAARTAVVALPGIDAAMAAEAARGFAGNGYWEMLAGSLSGVPYKLYALAAAEQGRAILPFLLLSMLLRLPRFLLAATVPAAIGSALSPWLRLRARLALLAAFWLIFYLFYFAAMPG